MIRTNNLNHRFMAVVVFQLFVSMAVSGAGVLSQSGESDIQVSQSEEAVSLSLDGDILWRLNYRKEEGKPYFHPLTTTNGQAFTDLRPKDHPWHRALWFSWKKINGVNYWEENRNTGKSDGSTKLLRVGCVVAPDKTVAVKMELAYAPAQTDKDVMTEKLKVTIHPPDTDGAYRIDWETVFTALAADVVLDRTPGPGQEGGKSYGGYAGYSLRMPKTVLGGAFLNSEGDGGTEANRTPARWMSYTAPDNGGGVLILDHPSNIHHPVKWYHVENMPYFSPAVIHDAPLTIKANENLSLRYRTVIYPATLAPKNAEKEWTSWIKGKEPVFDSYGINHISKMLPPDPSGFGRPIADRSFWSAMAQSGKYADAISQAKTLQGRSIPEQPDDLYLDFSRTGNRTRWQKVASERRGRLSCLVLAECLEGKGNFIAEIEEIVKILCAERTWVMPAHDTSLNNFNQKIIDIDLGSATLGWEMAMTHYLMGTRLDEDIRNGIEQNLRTRIWDPYFEMVLNERKRNFWLTTTNNWNAVCLAGVTGSALAVIKSSEERARFIIAAESLSQNFLNGFTRDGYCSEGLGYWNYGFGYYVMLCESIRHATNGTLDAFMDERAAMPALFGARIEIMNGISPAFADCSVYQTPSSEIMYYVNRRRGLGMEKYDTIDLSRSGQGLHSDLMYASPNSASDAAPRGDEELKKGLRDWFDAAGVLIARPHAKGTARIAVALKGGHNAEHHNHNDVGSYVVVIGREPLLVDPGAEVYTKRTFSSKRYDSKVLNSYGHPVPIIAGKLQRTGAGAKGIILASEFKEESDTIVMDMRSAYDAPELKTLTRTFIYSRAGAGSLTVEDRIEFASPQTYETALITLGKFHDPIDDRVSVTDKDLRLNVHIDTGGVPYTTEESILDEDVKLKVKPNRLGVLLSQPIAKGTIRLTIVPE